MLAAAFPADPAIALLGMTAAAMGALTGLPMFWPLANGAMPVAAAAAAVALVNSTGQIAGFVSPYWVGWIKDATGGTGVALVSLAAIMLIGAVIALRPPGRAGG